MAIRDKRWWTVAWLERGKAVGEQFYAAKAGAKVEREKTGGKTSVLKIRH
jgi:hypothetical protein